MVVNYLLSEAVMTLGYFALAYLMTSYLAPRHVTVLRKIFAALTWMIVLCGVTHGAKCVAFSFDLPWLMISANWGSGLAIWALLILLVPMLPAIMRFPNASKMGQANQELRQEVAALLDSNAKLATVDNLLAVHNITQAISAIRCLASQPNPPAGQQAQETR